LTPLPSLTYDGIIGEGNDKMKVTLGKKLFFYTATILVTVMAITFFFLVRGQARQWEEHLRSQSISFARFATPEILKQFRGSFPPQDDVHLDYVYDFLSFNRDLVSFSLYSPSGRLLFESPHFPDFIDLVLDDTLRDGLAERLQVKRTSVRTVSHSNGRVLDLLSPAFGPTGEQVLVARYIISYDSVDRLQAEMRQQFMRIGLLAVVASLLLAAIVARRVAGPVVKLTDGVQAIGRGELQTRMPVQGSDEISLLVQSFNEMSENLDQSRSALTEKNSALQQANAELQQVQAQLIRSERLAAIGQLAAGISHEIDNPVGIILGYAELLLDDCEPEDPRCDDLRSIIEECKRCKRITGGLLGFARSGSGRHETVDLDRLCRETIVSLSPQRLFKEVIIDYVRPESLLTVEGDGDQLRQILVNLMLNAAQAVQGRGKVVVKLVSEPGCAVITVADNGPGVPDEQREQIFEPFYSTKQRDEGTGLGLSLCRKLAEDHGGELSLDDAYANGAKFRLRLPL
jgi:signal transduction histidine kinase